MTALNDLALSDLGGRAEYFRSIVREADEPVFHALWERRVVGIMPFVSLMCGGGDTAVRFAMEQLPREVYFSGYYRRLLGGFERQLVRAGYLGAGEVDARVEGREGGPGRRRVSRVRLAVVSRMVRSMLRPTFPRWVCVYLAPRVTGTSRPALSRRRFSVGDRVRVRGWRALGHTRQPGYVTGKLGVVTAHRGATVFPDAAAVGRRARPQHCYTVAFEGRDLWGEAAEAGTEVRVDLFEAYLEPA